MLDTLRTIVQEVSAARNLQTALDTIVRKAKSAMHTEVCSIFLYSEKTSRYILMASAGLNPEAVGHVSLASSDGLVGLVGLKAKLVNLADAASHPKYWYLKETGEERYNAFLGVPIIHHRKTLGVLVVQQSAPRHFTKSEEAFLITMSAQLGGVLAHAQATGALDESLYNCPSVNRFQGVVGAVGVATGRAVIIHPPADLSSVLNTPSENINKDLAFFEQAIADVRTDMINMASKLSSRLPSEELALFDVYLRILDDQLISEEIRERVVRGMWVQSALKDVIEQQVRRFEVMKDPYFRERAADVRDLGQRILSYLQESVRSDVDYPEATILVSEELTPAMLGDVPHDRLAGLISMGGASNSHVAILARALGIPAVMGVTELPLQKLAEKQLIVDGNLGEVYSSPSKELLTYYQKVVEVESEFSEEMESVSDLPCCTADGHKFDLSINTGLMTDARFSLKQGASGVGLYRTEVPFIVRGRFPSESEQENIYRQQLEAFSSLPVTMRTLDIGGDKPLGYFSIKENNPFLGWRGIRITLDHPEIFLAQVRAMLRASVGLNNLRIMLPMITHVFEVDEALELIKRARNELKGEGVNAVMPLIGLMIEVPAAVYQIEELATRVDFFSVGSNDLTQYLLAVDRNNARVADLYSSLHPAVLKVLQKVVVTAHKAGKKVSICGEMVGNPEVAILLVAMGYDTLSMNPANLLKVKWALSKVSLPYAQSLLADVIQFDSAERVRNTLETALCKKGLGQVLSTKKRRING